MATEQQLLALPTAAFDFTLRDVLHWLVADKANTVFAFLFGIGFYLQMSRLTGAASTPSPIYRRRLAVLLVIGLLHNFFLWTWDILHLYALAGFVLLSLRQPQQPRRWSRADCCSRCWAARRQDLAGVLGLGGRRLESAAIPTRARCCARRSPSAATTSASCGIFFDLTMVDYVLTGFIVGWLAYALGTVSHRRLGRPARMDHARRGLPAGMAPGAAMDAARGTVDRRHGAS